MPPQHPKTPVTVPITIAIRRQLKSEFERTRFSPRELFKFATDVPKGLTARTVNRWLLAAVKEAERLHLDYVLKRLSQTPDAAVISNRRRRSANGHGQAMTQTMREFLASELIRTGATIPTLFKNMEHIPDGFSAKRLIAWVSGRKETDDPALWDFAVVQLAALPDKSLPSPPVLRPYGVQWNRADHKFISDQDWQALQDYRHRTGVSGAALLKDARDKPEGLNAPMVKAWLSRQTRTALPEHLAYVMARYREWGR